jgi:hypothetical protein
MNALRKRSNYVRLALLVALALTLGVTAVTSAYAWHNSRPGTSTYFGYDFLFPPDGHGSRYDSETICSAATGSAARWDFYYGWMTVALIRSNGSWVKSARSNAYEVAVFLDNLDPYHVASFNKKAHCVNSGNTTLWVRCQRLFWTDGSHCA